MPANYHALHPPDDRHSARPWHWMYRLLLWIGIIVAGTVALLALISYVVIPLAVVLVPELDIHFYDLGAYGVVPSQSYVSSNITTPQLQLVQWNPDCDDGLILLGLRGGSVAYPGPLIFDPTGDLVWTGYDQYREADNLKVQSYEGHDYLTFWNGERQAESGQGMYFMLDQRYDLAYTVSAVGVGLYGDMHEFKVTKDGTALITIFDRIEKDLSRTDVDLTGEPLLIDAIFQEIDVASGSLLFEWRASEHLESPYLNYSYQPYPDDGAFDYFHINSVDKDTKGNYLVSLRHLHLIVCINGETGGIMWALGGRSNDFEDLSGGEATNFEWQHDARWVDEKAGIISLFNNDITHNYFAAADSHSLGMIIHLDTEEWTAALLHGYESADRLASPSMGSMQVLPSTGEREQRVFVGWGAAGAYSEFKMNGELLCEAHFAPSMLFYFEAAKSYRATKVSKWHAVPTEWDPVAAIHGDEIYVSWNGATTVSSWMLQGSNPTESEPKRESKFLDLDVVQKEGFETSMELPITKDYAVYRVAALDDEGTVLRYSNIIECPSSLVQQYALAIILSVAVAVVFMVLAVRYRNFLAQILCKRRSGREHFKYELVERDEG